MLDRQGGRPLNGRAQLEKRSRPEQLPILPRPITAEVSWMNRHDRILSIAHWMSLEGNRRKSVVGGSVE